ncbi:hypothetical protein [Lusitaniella coriacea]|uniref:hypothetical protein n=1 Tax=Lusitaniella coriacea TaxID=1983105 RepID=UPI003CEBFA8D
MNDTSIPSHSVPPSPHPPVNIYSGSDFPLGAALTNPTETSKLKGKIQQSYPVSFRGNPYRPANTSLKAEKYFSDKPEGVPYVSAEDAYQAWKHTAPPGKERDRLMAEILVTKLEQHPQLFLAIEENGGTAWLEQCEHNVTGRGFWEGKGRSSPFIACLIYACEQVRNKQLTTAQHQPPVSQASEIRIARGSHPPTTLQQQPLVQQPIVMLCQVHCDLLSRTEGILVQQVNCQHKMGAGLAAAIARKFPQVKQAYLDKPRWELGEVQFVPVGARLFVANIAGQERYGRNRRHTDFVALQAGLRQVAELARSQQLPIHIPYRLGSGLAGGATEAEKQQTWERVKSIVALECSNATIHHPTPDTVPPHPDPVPRLNPIAHLPPLNPRVAQHTRKDIAMAALATQFVGRSAAPQNVLSSTRNYERAWGSRANTDHYTEGDIVMVSGSGPWRGVTEQMIERTFGQHYLPLLGRAIAARATILVGNAQGTDRLVQQYLASVGYAIAPHPQGFIQCQPPVREVQLPRDRAFSEEVQQRLTQQCVPIVAALLHCEGALSVEGKKYRATWNPQNRVLALYDRAQNAPKMLAYNPPNTPRWEALTLPNTEEHLTTEDAQHLARLAPALQQRLLDRYREGQ